MAFGLQCLEIKPIKPITDGEQEISGSKQKQKMKKGDFHGDFIMRP